MSNQTGTTFDKDEIVIKLDSSTALTSPLSGTTGTIASGITIKWRHRAHCLMVIISPKLNLPSMVDRLEMLTTIYLSCTSRIRKH